MNKRENINVKYKLSITVKDKNGRVIDDKDVGTLNNDPVLTLLQAFLKCIGVNTPSTCPQATGVQSVNIQLLTSNSTLVAVYPSQSGIGSITIGQASVSQGSFTFNFSATLNNSSLSGQYTINTLQIGATFGGMTYLFTIMNIGVTAQNGYVINVTLSGSVSVSPGGVLGSLYYQLFTEFWTEVTYVLGAQSSVVPVQWAGSGNAVTGYQINVSDPSGNVIGTYNSTTSSGQGISSIQISSSASGLTLTINVSFVLTPGTNDQISTIGFTLILNASLTKSTMILGNMCSYVTSSSGISGCIDLAVNVPQVTGSTYSVTAGSSYQITLTDSISISSST